MESVGPPAVLDGPAVLFEVGAGLAPSFWVFITRYAALALATFCVETGLLYHPGDMGRLAL